ncbi:unnamed protein product [Brachionus calyciflorus]|uniref:Uncharacterized protein n=1 Tax=Brachionus calyciflorus TaxID=104777 RepID=A0A814JY60_9BILA|nr:unnamed protein product [Brachionus calyciflorus]
MTTNGANHGIHFMQNQSIPLTQFQNHQQQHDQMYAQSQNTFSYNQIASFTGLTNNRINEENNSKNIHNANSINNFYSTEISNLGHNQEILIANETQNNNHRIKRSWTDLLVADFSLDDLMECLDEISQKSKVEFQRYFNDFYAEKMDNKTTKNRVKSLRDKLFKNYLKKFNHKQNIVPKERSCLDMIGDIHVLVTCYLDNTININILDLFSGINKEENIFNDISDMLSKQQEAILTKIQNENSKIMNKIDQLEKNLHVVYSNVNNNRDLIQMSFEKFKAEIDSIRKTRLNHETIPNNLKKRKMDNEVSVENEVCEEEMSKNTSNNSQVNLEENNKNNPSNLVQQKSQQNCTSNNETNISVNPIQDDNKEINENSTNVSQGELQGKKTYSSMVIKKPNNSSKGLAISTSINTNGTIRISYENKKVDNEGFQVSNGRKRNTRPPKGKVIGTALSDIKNLSAKSKPFQYYLGQWSPKVDPKKVYQLISSFANISKLEELSPNIPNRYFRAFKLTVDSHFDSVIRDGKNWPAGITVSRWYERNNNRPKGTNENLEVNHNSCIAEVVEKSQEQQINANNSNNDSIQNYSDHNEEDGQQKIS